MTTTRPAIGVDFYSGVYDRLYRLGYHRNPEYSHSRSLAAYALRYLDFDSVLDIGCSHGWAVGHFASHGKRAVGVDVSATAVRRAGSLGREAVVASATQIPFPDRSFDLVVSTDCFEHLRPEDRGRAIDEAIRVSNRYIALKVNPRADRNRWWKLLAGTSLHLSLLPVEDWIALFTARGCSLVYHDVSDEEFVLRRPETGICPGSGGGEEPNTGRQRPA